MTNDELINRLKALYPARDTTGFNYFDLLHAEGSPLQALFYARLFSPEFVEHEDMVFLRDTIEDDGDRLRVTEALARLDGAKQLVEKSFNTIEVPSLFGRRAVETSDDEDAALASILASSWESRLRAEYPERRFVVRVLSAVETGGEVGFVFHQQ